MKIIVGCRLTADVWESLLWLRRISALVFECCQIVVTIKKKKNPHITENKCTTLI